MRIEVIFTAQELNGESRKGRNTVVIDVLRATSVITTALNNGASAVIPFKEIEDALKYGAGLAEGSYVMGGERAALKIEGFQCGNSPLEYTADVIAGKELILTTTNGTLALELAGSPSYVMCFLNCKAVAKRLAQEDMDVVLVCAGTKGHFSTDDCLCAGLCISHLRQLKPDIELEDEGRFLEDFYTAYGSDIKRVLKDTKHYSYLMKLGMREDLEYCLQADLLDLVPICKDGRIAVDRL